MRQQAGHLRAGRTGLHRPGRVGGVHRPGRSGQERAGVGDLDESPLPRRWRGGQAIKADDLFEDLRASHADRATRSRVQNLSRLDVLLIEEFGYVNAPDPGQINDFFRLMDNRCNRKSTVITTNLGFEEWGKFLGNGPLTAALLSRLLQKCRTIVFPKEAVNLRNPKLALPARAEKPAFLAAV